ncbi:F0F1 ATP synthase subunit gamma [Nisaea sediminum]|uniref:F0F1 ATP synthase subunit gamma n=1 Tax=Nisaea sediminum TaxID=2775867 RepID=UPI0018679491|nr:F0F1 ATP synthase subunit gamma [Nisaea sediminum]
MSRVAEIEVGIKGTSELQNIIQAMRSLAGMRLRDAQQSVPGIRSYASIIADGIADTLIMTADAPAGRGGNHGSGPTAIVVCASEHGFVGGFNDRIVEAVLKSLKPDDRLFVLGSRGTALFEEHGHPTSWSGPMATRPAAVSSSVNELARELFLRIARGEIRRIDAVFSVSRPGGEMTIRHTPLLPLDPSVWKTRRPRQAPLHNMGPRDLLEQLTEEYVVALLTEAAVESIAAENAARLAATEAADHNISRMLSRLRQDARQARQSEITTEIVELVTGAAVAEEGSRERRHHPT